MEVEKMKNFFFPNYENMMPTTKSKMFISNTKGLKGSAWINSGVIMKKKPSKIERHYQLQLPKKKVDPF